MVRLPVVDVVDGLACAGLLVDQFDLGLARDRPELGTVVADHQLVLAARVVEIPEPPFLGQKPADEIPAGFAILHAVFAHRRGRANRPFHVRKPVVGEDLLHDVVGVFFLKDAAVADPRQQPGPATQNDLEMRVFAEAHALGQAEVGAFDAGAQPFARAALFEVHFQRKDIGQEIRGLDCCLLGQELTNEANNMLEEGKAALADPNRAVAYLVTNDDPVAITTTKYLWGSAQQVGLTIGGTLLNQGEVNDNLSQEFAPLTVTPLPQRQGDDWQDLMEALPNFKAVPQVPKPVEVNTVAREVRLFLPGLNKKQVKLTQYGPEITIEAGDQRRNLTLPTQLSGRLVKGAKFQDGYLIVSF